MTQPQQPETNGLAIASLILGILSVTLMGILTGIPAIITGAMGLKNPINRGMSIAGIIMGAISIIFSLLFIIFIVILVIIGAANDNSPSNPNDYYPPSQSTAVPQQT